MEGIKTEVRKCLPERRTCYFTVSQFRLRSVIELSERDCIQGVLVVASRFVVLVVVRTLILLYHIGGK